MCTSCRYIKRTSVWLARHYWKCDPLCVRPLVRWFVRLCVIISYNRRDITGALVGSCLSVCRLVGWLVRRSVGPSSYVISIKGRLTNGQGILQRLFRAEKWPTCSDEILLMTRIHIKFLFLDKTHIKTFLFFFLMTGFLYYFFFHFLYFDRQGTRLQYTNVWKPPSPCQV